MIAAMTTRALPLLLLAALAAPAAAQTDWVAHYHDRVAKFRAENAALPAGKRHLVLVGDSLTEGWSRSRIQRFLPAYADRTLNRGISSDSVGNNSRGVLNRLDASVFDTNPSHIVLLIGVNDIGRDGSNIDRTVRTLRTVLARIRERLPDVPLLLLQCGPARGGYAAYNQPVRTYNAKLRDVARELGLPTIDLVALLAGPDGLLPAAMTGDGLHWTDAAYEKLGAAIERALGAPAPQPPPPAPPPAPAPAGGKVETTASWLNVRDAPRTGTVLTSVPRGTRLEVVERDVAGWVKVRWGGREAWVSGQFVRDVATTGLGDHLPGN